jgi:Bacterial protein of unknown function (DUF937)
MSLMSMLEQAQDGQLFALVARSLDLDETETRNAMGDLCPAIALALKARASEDEELFQSLLDLIEDGKDDLPLDDPEDLTDTDAVADGSAILEDIYGSRNSAMVALRAAAPISATAVVAALALSNKPMTAAAPLPAAAQGEGGGILGSIIGAVIAGAVSGAMRELKPKTRSRKRYSTSRSRRKTTSSRRRSTSSKRKKSSAALEDIFRDILGSIVK